MGEAFGETAGDGVGEVREDGVEAATDMDGVGEARGTDDGAGVLCCARAEAARTNESRIRRTPSPSNFEFRLNERSEARPAISNFPTGFMFKLKCTFKWAGWRAGVHA